MHSENLKTRGAIHDIIENIRLAQDFTRGINFDTFKKDREKAYAVVRCLEIISEASRRLSHDIKNRNPQIRWQSLAAAGNLYRHEYKGIEEMEIWNAVENHLPPLLVTAEAELARLPEE